MTVTVRNCTVLDGQDQERVLLSAQIVVLPSLTPRQRAAVLGGMVQHVAGAMGVAGSGQDLAGLFYWLADQAVVSDDTEPPSHDAPARPRWNWGTGLLVFALGLIIGAWLEGR